MKRVGDKEEKPLSLSIMSIYMSVSNLGKSFEMLKIAGRKKYARYISVNINSYVMMLIRCVLLRFGRIGNKDTPPVKWVYTVLVHLKLIKKNFCHTSLVLAVIALFKLFRYGNVMKLALWNLRVKQIIMKFGVFLRSCNDWVHL